MRKRGIFIFWIGLALCGLTVRGFAQEASEGRASPAADPASAGEMANPAGAASPENGGAASPASQAQETAESAPAKEASNKIPGGMQGFVSLNLRNIDVIEALKFLSSRADIDIVTTKSVAGRVTLMVENVPVKDVFDIMLRSNRLAYDKRGPIYNVMTEEEYKALYGKPFSDPRQVETFRLNYAIPDQAFSLFDAMKSDIGRVLVDPESGQVLVIDIPERVHEMTRVIDAFEQKNEIRIFPLQYARAKDVEEQLRVQLDSKKLGFIRPDERANQVIVQTLPERMKEIERLISQLDKKTKEVIIDATIIKVKLSDEHLKGFEWEGLFDIGKREGKKGLVYFGSTPFATVNPVTTAGTFTSRKETFATEKHVGSFPFSGTTSSLSSSTPVVGSEEMHFGLVNAQDADMVLKYIQSLGKSKILANPKLVVTNNQESRIHVGEKQAYVTTTTTTGSATATVAEQISFVDIGIQLAMTPVINDDGFVTIKVKTEISSVASTLVTPTQNKIPIIDTSLAETTVMVKEGTTIVMGGLKRDEKTSSAKQTPLLGSIPFVGRFFKTGTDAVTHTELIILLTPRVITGDVFISDAGRRVEEAGVKSRQDYQSLKPAPAARPVAAVVSGPDVALTDKKGVFKGLRVLE